MTTSTFGNSADDGPRADLLALAPGAAQPLASGLVHFRDEFERHIRERRLPGQAARRRGGASTAAPSAASRVPHRVTVTIDGAPSRSRKAATCST